MCCWIVSSVNCPPPLQLMPWDVFLFKFNISSTSCQDVTYIHTSLQTVCCWSIYMTRFVKRQGWHWHLHRPPHTESGVSPVVPAYTRVEVVEVHDWPIRWCWCSSSAEHISSEGEPVHRCLVGHYDLQACSRVITHGVLSACRLSHSQEMTYAINIQHERSSLWQTFVFLPCVLEVAEWTCRFCSGSMLLTGCGLLLF